MIEENCWDCDEPYEYQKTYWKDGWLIAEYICPCDYIKTVVIIKLIPHSLRERVQFLNIGLYLGFRAFELSFCRWQTLVSGKFDKDLSNVFWEKIGISSGRRSPDVSSWG